MTFHYYPKIIAILLRVRFPKFGKTLFMILVSTRSARAATPITFGKPGRVQNLAIGLPA
jgi:hypothetical protein